jgi:hypothetical protein
MLAAKLAIADPRFIFIGWARKLGLDTNVSAVTTPSNFDHLFPVPCPSLEASSLFFENTLKFL